VTYFETVPDKKAREIRTARYSLAMHFCGNSRLFELTPISSFASPAKGNLLDVMSGDGFVSRYLGGPFKVVHAVDENAVPFSMSSNVTHFFQCDAGNPDLIESLGYRYNRIIALAGFHHLMPGPSSMPEQILEYRVQCLIRWRALLVRGGRLVIGDVPAPNQPASSHAPVVGGSDLGGEAFYVSLGIMGRVRPPC
jgi:hypothetical protein